MLPRTPLSEEVYKRLRDLQARCNQSEIPLTVRLAFMVDCLRLSSRLPSGVKKEIHAIRALTPETASVTARKTIAKRCKAWILAQQTQPSGFEHGEVLSMQLVLEVLNEYERKEVPNWTEHFQFFLQGVALLDETLNPAIVALMRQHFGDGD